MHMHTHTHTHTPVGGAVSVLVGEASLLRLAKVDSLPEAVPGLELLPDEGEKVLEVPGDGLVKQPRAEAALLGVGVGVEDHHAVL